MIYACHIDHNRKRILLRKELKKMIGHIMVYYYGTNKVFVQTDFAGTIIAPNAEVVVGQAGKNFYGSIDNHEPSRYSVVF